MTLPQARRVTILAESLLSKAGQFDAAHVRAGVAAWLPAALPIEAEVVSGIDAALYEAHGVMLRLQHRRAEPLMLLFHYLEGAPAIAVLASAPPYVEARLSTYGVTPPRATVDQIDQQVGLRYMDLRECGWMPAIALQQLMAYHWGEERTGERTFDARTTYQQQLSAAPPLHERLPPSVLPEPAGIDPLQVAWDATRVLGWQPGASVRKLDQLGRHHTPPKRERRGPRGQSTHSGFGGY